MMSEMPEWKIFKVFVTILVVLLFNYIFPLIFNFMNIEQSVYQIYLYWMTAIIVLYLVLPENVGTAIFTQRAPEK
tara:strand:+ start:3202 stop:3426 length:225 start_codon:yes stop_codon:yes gene_type:complete